MAELSRETMYNLLREVKSVAQYASLTGALKRGARVLVETYNQCLEALAEQGDPVAKTLFRPLSPETASIDDVGVAAALLCGYLRPEKTGRRRHEDEEDEQDEEF